MTFNRLLGQRRHARGNLPVNWNVRNPDLHGRSNECPSLARVSIKKAFTFQCGNVLHHRCLAGEAEMVLDFACAWGHALLALLALNKIQNASLPLGQHVGIIL